MEAGAKAQSGGVAWTQAGVGIGQGGPAPVPRGRHFVGVRSKGRDGFGGGDLEEAAAEEASEHERRRGCEEVPPADAGPLAAVRVGYCAGGDQRVVGSSHDGLWVARIGIGAGGVVHEANASVDGVANVCARGRACCVNPYLSADRKIIIRIVNALFRR